MQERLEVSFPAGKRVHVRIGDFEIATDQSVALGGEASAPSPFDLFLASIAACAGVYALNFCQTRQLATAGLAVSLAWQKDESHPSGVWARLLIRLPEGFPPKYREGIVRAMDLCAVKKRLQDPPRFSTEILE